MTMLRTIRGMFVTLAILLLLGGAAASAQTVPERFKRKYEVGYSGTSTMSNVWPTTNGYLAIMFKTDSVAPGNYYYGMETMVLDSFFNIQSRKNYGDTARYYLRISFETTSTPDGLGNFWYWVKSYFPADSSYGLFYGKFDKNGIVIFEHQVPDGFEYEYPWNIVSLSNGGGVLCEQKLGTFAYQSELYFMDSIGTILQVDTILPYNVNHYHAANYLTVDLNRREVLVPTMDEYQFGLYSSNYRPRLFIYDFQGNLLRWKNYANTLLDNVLGEFYRTEDGGYIGSLTHYINDSLDAFPNLEPGIVKLDSNMNVEWKHYFFGPKLYNQPAFFSKDSLGNYYMGGTRDIAAGDSLQLRRWFLIKFSSNFDSLWARTYTVEDDSLVDVTQACKAILTLKAGSLLCLVTKQSSYSCSYLYKLDSCGYLTERCVFDTVIPPPPDTLGPDPDGHVIAYPNPSNGVWSLIWDVNVGDQSQLRVFDIAGRELIHETIVREERPSHLDFRDWGQGVYLLEIKSELGRVFRTKVLLIR